MMALAVWVMAQMPVRISATRAVPPDSADVARQSRPRFWRAAAEVVGTNAGVWAFDRYVADADYAHISLKSIRDNLREGFVWDNDQLGTNMFLHPYNGSLYFNAARSSGFNFWQSGCFALAGSAMWELFMECEPPSTNDIIATPVGGMCIGEVTYRASDAIIDDRTGGAERVAREIGAFIVSPMRGLNRLISGDMWRRRATSGRMFGIPNLAMEMSLGVNVLDFRHDDCSPRPGGIAKINIEYGDRFEVRSKKPYDYFTFSASLNMMRRQPVLQHLSIQGRLLARELLDSRGRHLSVGMFQHFDYYDSDTINAGAIPYKLGVPASVGAGLYFRDVERSRFVLDAYAHVNGVMLAGILTDYYRVDMRNYNLAMGFSTKIGANIVIDDGRWAMSVRNELFQLYTWKGYSPDTDLRHIEPKTFNVMGDKSRATFCVTSLRADWRMTSKLYLTLNLEHYLRVTRYSYHPTVRSTTLGAQLMLTYKL